MMRHVSAWIEQKRRVSRAAVVLEAWLVKKESLSSMYIKLNFSQRQKQGCFV